MALLFSALERFFVCMYLESNLEGKCIQNAKDLSLSRAWQLHFLSFGSKAMSIAVHKCFYFFLFVLD